MAKLEPEYKQVAFYILKDGVVIEHEAYLEIYDNPHPWFNRLHYKNKQGKVSPYKVFEEAGTVTNKSLWLPEKDIHAAIVCFQKYYESVIEREEERIRKNKAILTNLVAQKEA